jgi:hypothetical protein
MIIILIWIYFGTYSELKETYLMCRFGPFFSRISYDSIKSIKKVDGMLSSMASSTKQLEIKEYGKKDIFGTTYISPENREEFINELKKRCSKLN